MMFEQIASKRTSEYKYRKFRVGRVLLTSPRRDLAHREDDEKTV